MATRLDYTDLCQNYETVEGLSMPGPFLSYIIMKIVSCGEHGHVVVEKGPINIRNKEGRYMLVVYALGHIFLCS